MLLYVSERAISLTSAPYPPFGLVSVATVGLASYLIMIALYYSAISLSNEIRTRKIILDSALQEFSLLSNIGFAQNEKEIENMVDKVVKKHSAVIETKAAEIISPEDIKEYTLEVLNEVKNLKGH
jgi:delta-aminolevulinic acid dehydratase/porphobilinogen synthase